jgi:2-polyprenyl-3-methyl-5-hydroxy-6-metoxy-1,4-benzoquinol methylase
MNSYTDRFASYYDLIYSSKNYIKECDLIKKYGQYDGRLLDIGAGTLNHSIILSKYFSKITATDFSSEMLNRGKSKLKSSGVENVTTHYGDLDNVIEIGEFDTVISMFNVVNHIINLDELILFFNKVSSNLKNKGYFIFDCWNGVNSIVYPPTPSTEKTFIQDAHTVVVKTETDTDLINLFCNMKTTVVVYDDIEQLETFSYNLLHKLWPSSLLKEMLEIIGFDVKIIPYFDDDKNYNLEDRRITFICKKLNDATNIL